MDIVDCVLIAEDLLLLLTDDNTGKPVVDSTALDHALAGAVLLELTLSGVVDLAGAGETVRKDRLVIRRPGATGDDVLDEALTRLERKIGKKPQDAVPSLTKHLRARLYERLTERGIVNAERAKVLGLFPRTRWPAADSDHERRVRTQLTDLLVHGISADARAAALVSLLSAINAVSKVVDHQEAGIAKGDLKRRAKVVAEGDWAADAVRKSVEVVNAGVTAAIVAGATAGATSS